MMENGEVLMGKDNLGQSKMIIWEGMGLPKVLHQRHVHFEFVQLNNSKTVYKVIKNIHVPIK